MTTALQMQDEATSGAAGGTPVDRRVMPRAAFEAWISAPPYERWIERFGDGSAWPGNYRDIGVDLAWNAWIDAVTMTRERCAQVCEEVHADTGECPEMALYCAARIRGA